MYQETTALHKLSKLTKRIKGVQGGTSASKTISILQLLIHKCQTDTTPALTSITSESMPHLKRGAMRDFKNIMMEHNYWKDSLWNASDYIYTFETGTPLEFFSLDMPHKVRGPRRKRLFINEANNIPYETFDQLEVRTEDEIWLDWNPVTPFWWHESDGSRQAVSLRDDAEGIVLTYKDNEGLPASIVNSIESRKGNKLWWQVYGMGQLGEVEGKIYSGWQVIEDIPHEAQLVRYGLDFGYTNDFSSLVAIYRHNGGFIIDEILHQKGLSNKQIADTILLQKKALVIADSAEPKSIDEIKSYGVVILPSTKGPGSVLQRIQYVQDQKISVTKHSINIIKEYRNYLWMTDKNGKIINEPDHTWSHSMDAIGYGMHSLKPVVANVTMPPPITPSDSIIGI